MDIKAPLKYVHGWAFPACDVVMSRGIGADGSYQFDSLHAALKHVTLWRTAIDAGAHVGTWSRALAKRFVKVIAFEPAEDTFAALTINCPEVDCRNQAVGASSGLVRMAIDPRYGPHHTGARYIREGGKIDRIAIDSLDLVELDFLKLDLEGGETDALKGARQTLERCRPVVVFEDKRFGRRFGYDREMPLNVLKAIGAQEFDRVGRNRIWGWRG
jgi:FkbM family methyltransferase